MTFIIDRRLNAKNKSTVNRQRFIDRYRKHIKKAVSDAVKERSITDMERGGEISISDADLSEPAFNHGSGGDRSTVHPGNKEFTAGDKIPRPKNGGKGSGGKPSDSGEGMDEFVFQINQDEFLEFMFEDLELPNMVKRQLAGTDSFTFKRGGFANTGTPNQLNIVRSLRSAHARRIALGNSKKRRLKTLQAELGALLDSDEEPAQEKITGLEEDIAALKNKLSAIPFIDDFDLKYNLNVKHPNPTSKAVMFCIMDVSGSMNQETKDIAKRFFILLYLFLTRNYDKIDIVFIDEIPCMLKLLSAAIETQMVY